MTIDMNRLIVLGNGFDRAHGLLSGYWSFKEHLERVNRGLHDTLISLGGGDLWSDLESSLAHLQLYEYAESLCEQEIAPGDRMFNDDYDIAVAGYVASTMRQVVERVTDQLRHELFNWISEIDQSAAKAFLQCIHPYESFLSFNYTTTVERLYEVPAYHVCHIHGKVGNDIDYRGVWQLLNSMRNTLSREPDILFGHGMREVDAVIPNLPFRSQTLDYDLNYAHETLRASYEEIYASYERSRKKIEDSLPVLTDFLSARGPFSSINIIGHSLSAVDLPYFDTIAAHVGENVEYMITYFSEGAREEIVNRARSFVRGAPVQYIDASLGLTTLK